jgi:hypothetical protein
VKNDPENCAAVTSSMAHGELVEALEKADGIIAELEAENAELRTACAAKMTEHRTVPVEPTEEMVIAANEAMFGTTVFQGPAMVDIYKAMLAAAPQPDNELAKLENESIEWMISDWNEHYSGYRGDGWIDTTQHPSSWFVKGMRIIELNGLLERHPTHSNLVRVKE